MNRAQRRAAGHPVKRAAGAAGYFHGIPVYEAHVSGAMDMPGGGVGVALGVGAPDEYPSAYLAMCPHAAMDLADELRSRALHVLEASDGPTCGHGGSE